MNEHGEHHRCERCEARGRAEAEAKVAALTEERDRLRGGRFSDREYTALQARVAALTAALKRHGHSILCGLLIGDETLCGDCRDALEPDVYCGGCENCR